MENNNETIENKVAAILAGLSMNDRDLIVKVLENKYIVIYVKGDEHYKKIFIVRCKPITINITFDDLVFLITYIILDDVHASYRLNFERVVAYCLMGRDVFAVMSNKELVPIRRADAKAFKQKCKSQGKMRDKDRENGPNVK
jgi:hypothetical protein